MGYFGEEYGGGGCSMCDNCISPPALNDDLTIPAQMFLSCIKRSGERFGTGHVIDILRGSKSKKIRELGHASLSTYGIGKDYAKNTWQSLARQFIQSKLIFQDGDNYGVLKITDKGYRVMKGLEPVMGSLKEVKAHRSMPEGGDYDEGLFELLRDKRKEIAREENAPPYVIFSDKTLIGIASSYPQSTESLSEIHGIGSRKIEKYGDIILAAVRKYVDENEIDAENIPPSGPVKRQYMKIPRHVQIGEMYNSGISITEIEENEGIKRRTILSNLNRYIGDGYSLKSQGLMQLLPEDSDNLSSIINAFEELGTEFLKPVYEELGKTVDYDTLEICRLYYHCSD